MPALLASKAILASNEVIDSEADFMGLQRMIRLGDETPLAWETIAHALHRIGKPPALRMIDQELCLPGETPPDSWQELRLALEGGMVTLRREVDGLACIVWGNADEVLLHSWRCVIWAVLEATGSAVDEEGQLYAADAYASRHRLLPD